MLQPVLLAVNPVPWARSQMAFTLAFHIILVPLGVSWAALALIANYRGIKRNDADALLLAQRWSKYMAVTFAVGAVTGTVLSFEFGLLWPKFMGQWGQAFGIPFAFEGIFFFTEAIFVAIYIYGWRRLKPWTHFWTGVPVVITGILGSVSVVAANAWMNDPSGFTLNSCRQGGRRRPVGRDLQRRDAADGRAHGRRRVRRRRLPHRLGLRGRHAARPTGQLPPHRLPHRVHRRRPGDAASRWASATRSPDGCTTTSRSSSPPSSWCRPTSSDVPETLFGHLNSDGTVTGGIPIPGLASILSDPADGTATVVQGLNTEPDRRRADVAEVNTVHLAWDVMVGLGTAAVPAVAVVPRHPRLPQANAKSKLFLILASGAGVAAVVTMEAGWVVSEVGRQPWIVYNLMKVEDAATGNSGVWITFLLVLALYIGLGVTTILILRKMSRRYRERELSDDEVPYGPRTPGRPRQPTPTTATR